MITTRAVPALLPAHHRHVARPPATHQELCRPPGLHPSQFVLVKRIEAQFTALRYFTFDGTDHATHQEQGGMIRRYIIWRNNHAYDKLLRRIVARANVA